ncbi:MAG: DUF5752 family protein [Candidatus Zixiibacteriota bacterium]
MKSPAGNTAQPFQVKDCSLITLSTGLRARTLRELRERIGECEVECLDYHFFATKLRPAFDDPEYPNDFAAWAGHTLGDRALAERLSMINPFDYSDAEELREATIALIQDSLDEQEHILWARQRHEFIFLRSQIVTLDTGLRPASPAEMGKLIPALSTGSVYYHFVEARRRVPGGRDDFSAWIEGSGPGYERLGVQLGLIDYYFCSLSELRDRVAGVFQDFQGESSIPKGRRA